MSRPLYARGEEPPVPRYEIKLHSLSYFQVLKPVLRCEIVPLGVRLGSQDINANCILH